jgi:hypothetical protein
MANSLLNAMRLANYEARLLAAENPEELKINWEGIPRPRPRKQYVPANLRLHRPPPSLPDLGPDIGFRVSGFVLTNPDFQEVVLTNPELLKVRMQFVHNGGNNSTTQLKEIHQCPA